MFKFKSRERDSIIYFDNDAKRILEIVGKEASSQGIITKAQIPGAIAALESAIQAEDEKKPAAEPVLYQDEKTPAASSTAQQDEEAPAKGVSLRQRAQPFLQLLQASLDAGHDVVWGV